MTELPPVLKALANERKSIAYRPEFAKMTGSVLAAIVLQQILYRFDQNECEKFYKFAQPCKHKLYKEGDSWIEELGFSRTELATALKKIGIKSTKGTNKADLMAVEKPEFDDKGLLKNASSLVVYWTDKSRVTWYWLNTTLLGNAITMNYLGNSTILNYLVNQETRNTYEKQESGFTSIPKITKDKPERKKRAPKIPKGVVRSDGAAAIVNGWAKARGFTSVAIGAPVGSKEDWERAEIMAAWPVPPSEDEIRQCVKQSNARVYQLRFLEADVVNLRAKRVKKPSQKIEAVDFEMPMLQYLPKAVGDE